MDQTELTRLLGVDEKWLTSRMEPAKLVEHFHCHGVNSMIRGDVRWTTVVNTLDALTDLVERSVKLLGHHDIDPSGVPGCIPGCSRCAYEADVLALFTYEE